mgnify:FL=1
MQDSSAILNFMTRSGIVDGPEAARAAKHIAIVYGSWKAAEAGVKAAMGWEEGDENDELKVATKNAYTNRISTNPAVALNDTINSITSNV